MCPYGKMCIMIFMFLSQLKNTDGRLGDLHISISPYVNCSGLRDGPRCLLGLQRPVLHYRMEKWTNNQLVTNTVVRRNQ